jgi:hypothetical protein
MSPRNLPPLPDEEFRETVSIDVLLLADRKDAIPVLTKWYEQRWPAHYGPGGAGDAGRDLASSCSRDELPITLAAFQRKGVELYLVVAVEELASKLGVEAVFASTGTESPLLIRRNWKVVEEPDESGTDLYIFKRAL